MARESDRGATESSPTLPNVLLIIVLVLLLAWGIAGLYLPPEGAALSGGAESAITADTVAPKPLGNVVTEVD